MKQGTIEKVTDLLDSNKREVFESQYKDYIIPKNDIGFHFDYANNKFVLSNKNWQENKGLLIKPYAHKGISAKLDIAWSYYRRMMTEAPDLLCANLTHWLDQVEYNSKGNLIDRKFLIRADKLHDAEYPSARAFLSNKYLSINNSQVAPQMVRILQSNGLTIKSADITDEKMYIKAINENVVKEATYVGDDVQFGVTISNSEIGVNAIEVKCFIYRLVCTNGMTAPVLDNVYRRKHLGNVLHSDDDLNSSDQQNKVNGIIEEASTYVDNLTNAQAEESSWVDTYVNEMKQSSMIQVNSIKNVLDYTSKNNPNITFTKEESQMITNHAYVNSANDTAIRTDWKDAISLYDVAQGITRTAQDVQSYDRASLLEEFGYKVMNTNIDRLNASVFGKVEDTNNKTLVVQR